MGDRAAVATLPAHARLLIVALGVTGAIGMAACSPHGLAGGAPVASEARATPSSLSIAGAVLPYSYEVQAADRLKVPFFRRFEHSGNRLTFVATHHGCDPATLRLIDEAFGPQVRLAIIEGLPASRGTNPERFTKHLQGWQAAGFCEGGGEPAYTAQQALKRGAPYMGGEPDEPAVAAAVLAQGFKAEDLLGFYMVRQIPQYRSEGTLAKRGLDGSFLDVMQWMGREAGLQEVASRLSLAWFRDWYREHQGHAFDADTMDPEEAAPVLEGLLTQRISSVVGRVRDQFTVELIARELASYGDVLVVYGGSHFATVRPAIERLLGPPVEEKGVD